MDAAFRAVMFTDIVDSTGMTARLGDVRALEMVRAHDGVVRRAMGATNGREVKHTGDGLMASFDDPTNAVDCACKVQRALGAFNNDSAEKLIVRIGIHAGEPVEDSRDLFGATVQIAARLCQFAPGGSIVVSDEMRPFISAGSGLVPLGTQHLKGLRQPMEVYQVTW